MAKTTPFAYNSGSTIPGTIQVGDFAIGNTPQDYSSNPGGKTWYMGPDEDLGYVFSYTASTHSGATGGPAVNFGFYRTTDLTTSAYTAMTQFLSVKQGDPQTFDTIFSADTWLTTNGYWNSLTQTFFISTWQTTNPNEIIELPYIIAGTYDGIIDWGDGTTTGNTYENRFHTYDTAGTYTIKISGTINGWTFAGVPVNKNNIRTIEQWGNFNTGDEVGGFSGCTNLNIANVIDVIDLSGVTTLNSMFGGCNNLVNINRIDEWNVSGITDMGSMFRNATIFNGDISTWNVSSVTNMESMFANSQFSQQIGSWDVSSVTNMSGMFANSGFDQPIGDWDVSNVTNMIYMFAAGSIFNQPIGNWDVRNVDRDNMYGMFDLNTTFIQDISTWCVENILSKPTDFDNGTSGSWGENQKPDWGVAC